jgi:hypothetical protein
VSVARPFGFGEKKKRRIRKAPEQKKKKRGGPSHRRKFKSIKKMDSYCCGFSGCSRYQKKMAWLSPWKPTIELQELDSERHSGKTTPFPFNTKPPVVGDGGIF